MSNKSETTATEKSTATETAPKKEKAPAGSSIAAQCKTLVVAIALETKEALAKLNEGITKASEQFSITDFMSASTAEWLENVASEIGETQQRGLPLEVRLANVNTEINEHYQAMPIVNGKASTTPEWEAKTQSLFTKRANIERAIRREKEETDAKTETAKA